MALDGKFWEDLSAREIINDLVKTILLISFRHGGYPTEFQFCLCQIWCEASLLFHIASWNCILEREKVSQPIWYIGRVEDVRVSRVKSTSSRGRRPKWRERECSVTSYSQSGISAEKKNRKKKKKISRNPPNHFSSDIILEERPQKTPLPNNPSSHIPRPPRLLRLPLPGFQPLARVQLDRPPRLQLVRHRRRLHLVRRAAFGPGPARKFSPVLLIPNLLMVRVRAVDFVPGGAAVAVFCCCCCFSGCGFGGCLAAAAEEEEDAGEEQGEGGADADDDAGDGAAGDGRVVG